MSHCLHKLDWRLLRYSDFWTPLLAFLFFFLPIFKIFKHRPHAISPVLFQETMENGLMHPSLYLHAHEGPLMKFERAYSGESWCIERFFKVSLKIKKLWRVCALLQIVKQTKGF